MFSEQLHGYHPHWGLRGLTHSLQYMPVYYDKTDHECLLPLLLVAIGIQLTWRLRRLLFSVRYELKLAEDLSMGYHGVAERKYYGIPSYDDTNTNFTLLSPSRYAHRISDSRETTAFYGTRKFITAFTTLRHLLYPKPDRSNPCHSNSRRSVLILSSIYVWVFQLVSFPQVSPPKPCMHHSSSPYMLHVLPIPMFLIC
jgi:hypothetical protein